jgi:ATP-dependent RNA helicase SUPV3L1/SUV3
MKSRKAVKKTDPAVVAPRKTRQAIQRREKELGEVSDFQSVKIRVIEEVDGPNELVIHSGATNSGKTYDSLVALAETGNGVYAAPLRMLAREAYEKLVVMCGESQVGLITGEEHINTDAPIICATTEAAPLTGDIAVIDECHWLSDKDRGWAWTRLLISGRFKTIHAITDPSAVNLILSLVPDALTTEVIRHERLGELHYGGKVPVHKLPAGSAVVTFSRRSVHAIADHLTAMGRKPAVLYGALPPNARRNQIEKLVSGEADIIVTTDVIGHGINLPLTAVALAETWKFDGTERRPLHLWEAAQILGRAGRYGHGSDAGYTYTVTGLPWFDGNEKLVQTATQAAAGVIPTNMQDLTVAPLRPVFGELAVTSTAELLDAVDAWALTAQRASTFLPLTGFNSKLIRDRVRVWRGMTVVKTVEPLSVWKAASCPVDDDTLALVGLLASHHHENSCDRLGNYRQRAENPGRTLGSAEAAARLARDLRTLTSTLGDLPGLTKVEAGQIEELASLVVVARLSNDVGASGIGTCGVCHSLCPPWFGLCETCHQQGYMVA